MGIQYAELRQTIYQTKEEFQRFRQLLVNGVLATDIMDKDLKQLRNSRWEKTFADTTQHSDDGEDGVNRKATIVIERKFLTQHLQTRVQPFLTCFGLVLMRRHHSGIGCRAYNAALVRLLRSPHLSV